MLNIKILKTVVFIVAVYISTNAQIPFKKLPNFELEDGYGNKITSEELIHPTKSTLLLLYGSWGTPCNKSVTILNDLHQNWSDKYDADIKVIALDNRRNKTFNWLRKNGKISTS